ncbi:betaine--homocysteine S-methyltransferase 1-like [Liolophura sinensis]|uniref:betaine--homocysteine S-methyltransferase 1-like n=1 Tax=Liolophura sinensis TaxID=3198878 RepID=UPI0031591FAD
MPVKGLVERLAAGENVIIAEGYLFEFERRGYLKAGAYAPEVVIEHPDLVKSLHEEFVHAGSDVVLAFTYYGHREKLRVIGRENDLEKLNRTALKIARQVANDTGTLMAGNICNSTVFKRDDRKSQEAAKAIFKEQIEWAVEEGADFIIGETYSELAEALLALETIKEYGKGLPAVITFISHMPDHTLDGVPYGQACRRLEEAGAAVVGLNCGRGPCTMLPLLKEIKEACKGPIAALPVPYRTYYDRKNFQSLKDAVTGERSFPVDLPAHACSRHDIAMFAREAKQIGVQFIGLCCGNASHYLRVLAEEYGRTPAASKYSPDMSQHFCFGSKDKFDPYYTEGLMKDLVGTT